MNLFVACILFADDMVLLAPSRSALQQMIDICRDFCERYCLSFNVKKSKVMVFGKRSACNILPLTLNGSPIDFIEEWKYLGTTVKAGCQLNFVARPDIAAFFRATN